MDDLLKIIGFYFFVGNDTRKIYRYQRNESELHELTVTTKSVVTSTLTRYRLAEINGNQLGAYTYSMGGIRELLETQFMEEIREHEINNILEK